MLLFTDDPSDPTRVTTIHFAPERLRQSRRNQGVEADALPDYPDHSEASSPVLRLRGWQPVYDVEPIPPTRTEREEAGRASRKLVAKMVRDDALDATEVAGVTAIFPLWRVGLDVGAGDVLLWDGGLVECIQPHTTQGDWTPDLTPALWKDHRSAAEPGEWVEPTGSHDAYQAGDRVTFEGGTYESTIDANVWAPDVHGWALA